MTLQESIEIITNAIQTENMTAEQDKALAIRNYLEKIKLKDDFIELKTAELQQMKCKVTNITAQLNPCPGSSGNSSDKIGGLVSKIVDQEKYIYNLLEDFFDYKQKCIEVLEKVRLENINCYKILHRRYILYCENFKSIAEIEGFSYAYTLELHSKGLDIAQKFFDISESSF